MKNPFFFFFFLRKIYRSKLREPTDFFTNLNKQSKRSGAKSVMISLLKKRFLFIWECHIRRVISMIWTYLINESISIPLINGGGHFGMWSQPHHWPFSKENYQANMPKNKKINHILIFLQLLVYTILYYYMCIMLE